MSADKPSLDASSPSVRNIKSSSSFLSLKYGVCEPIREKVPVILDGESDGIQFARVAPPKPQHRYGNSNKKFRPSISSAFVPHSPTPNNKKRTPSTEMTSIRPKSPRSDISISVKKLVNISKSSELGECRLIIPGSEMLRRSWIIKGPDDMIEFDVEGKHLKNGIICISQKSLILEVIIGSDNSLILVQFADDATSHDMEEVYERLLVLADQSPIFSVSRRNRAAFALSLHNYTEVPGHAESKMNLKDSNDDTLKLETSRRPVSSSVTASSSPEKVVTSKFFSDAPPEEVPAFEEHASQNDSQPEKSETLIASSPLPRRKLSTRSSDAVKIVKPSTFPKHAAAFGQEDFRHTFGDGKEAVIGPADFKRLDDDEYLNDTLIDFFLKLISEKGTSPAIISTTYIFNTFFFEKLSQKDEQTKKHEKVMKWTAKVNLFDMKNIIIPVFSNMHWYMAIVHNLPLLLNESSDNEAKITGVNEKHIKHKAPVDVEKEPLIMIFDSLRRVNYNTVYKTLRDYIAAEALDKLGLEVNVDALRAKIITTPQQTNYCDCGVYLIHYVERYLEDPDQFVRTVLAVGTERNQQAISELWQLEKLSKKRDSLREVLLLLKEEKNEKSNKGPTLAKDDHSEDFEIVLVNETKRK